MTAKAGFLKSFSEKSHINDRLVRLHNKKGHLETSMNFFLCT